MLELAHLVAHHARFRADHLAVVFEGERRIEEMIADDIAAAQRRGDLRHSAVLEHVLRQDVARHPLGQQAQG